MPVPKRRTSKRKKNTRRAHDSLTVVLPISCTNCGENTLPHRACPACGHYRGRRIVTTVED